MGLRRSDLFWLLGYPDGLETAGAFAAARRQQRDGVEIAEGVIKGPRGALPALRLAPREGARGAAVLYAHAHGNRYEIGKREVIEGRPALMSPPLGLALAQAGHLVLCPDLPGFGARQGDGHEAALAKAALWQGRCLLGDMLADLGQAAAALQALAPGRPLVPLGLSMGATLAYWFAALDPRAAGVAHFCAFADMGPLIASGAHDLHGPYMTVPGLLAAGEMGDVAALVAPRPQLVGLGLCDPLTPPAALRPALLRLRRAYRGRPGLDVIEEPEGGHQESPAMRAALMRFLARI